MDKQAQQRGFFNKLREKVNISGKILESLNREFSLTMDNLRDTDSTVRVLAKDVRQAARNVVSDVRRRDYLSAANNVAGFHQRLRHISNELDKFLNSVNIRHFDFLLDQLDDETKEKVFKYNPNFEIKNNDEQPASFPDTSLLGATEAAAVVALVKNADKKDWWWQITQPIEDVAHNVFKGRGIAFRGLEKRFAVPFLRELKSQSEVMARETWAMLQKLLAAFKQLAKALARRKLKEYMDTAKKLIGEIKRYHERVVWYFGNNKEGQPNAIAQLKAYMKAEEEKQKAEEEKQKALQSPPVFTPNPAVEKQIGEAMQTYTAPATPTQLNQMVPETQEQPMYQGQTLQDLTHPEGENIPINLNRPKFQEMDLPKEQPKSKITNLRDRPASNFINTLQKFAIENNPQAMIREILATSDYLEDIDTAKSLQLLSIAEGIIEDYKKAGIFDWMKGKKPEDDTQPAQTKEKQPIPLHHRPPVKPVNPNIPEGRIDAQYQSIPFLNKISPNQIRITFATAEHINKTFTNRLYNENIDIHTHGKNLENQILNAIKQAITQGIILRNFSAEDAHNPNDRILEIRIGVDLRTIDPQLEGYATIKVLCRLSVKTGILTLRTIQRDFPIEIEREEDYGEEEPQDYDYPDYDDRD